MAGYERNLAFVKRQLEELGIYDTCTTDGRHIERVKSVTFEHGSLSFGLKYINALKGAAVPTGHGNIYFWDSLDRITEVTYGGRDGDRAFHNEREVMTRYYVIGRYKLNLDHNNNFVDIDDYAPFCNLSDREEMIKSQKEYDEQKALERKAKKELEEGPGLKRFLLGGIAGITFLSHFLLCGVAYETGVKYWGRTFAFGLISFICLSSGADAVDDHKKQVKAKYPTIFKN